MFSPLSPFESNNFDPNFFILYFVELPAAVFHGLWLFFQFISAALTESAGATANGIAWWDHIGGLILIVFLKPFLFIPEKW